MLHTAYSLQCYGITDIGQVREHNEDVWLASPEEGFFLVADGMGGHLAGEVAAKMSVDFLAEKIKAWKARESVELEEALSFFENALKETNSWIYKKGKKDASLNGMGTTVSLLYFLRQTAIIAHVGDSRIYRLRHRKIECLTEDHTLVSEMIGLGVMSADEGKTFPYKHILTRAIGTQANVQPDVLHFAVEPGDLFLLCTDGLTNFVKEEEIQEILSSEESLEKKGCKLVGLANGYGGGDNITALLVNLGK